MTAVVFSIAARSVSDGVIRVITRTGHLRSRLLVASNAVASAYHGIPSLVTPQERAPISPHIPQDDQPQRWSL